MWARVFADKDGYFREAEVQYNVRDVYRDHYAHARAITPKEWLLEFSLKEGWDPHCDFFGQGAARSSISQSQRRRCSDVQVRDF